MGELILGVSMSPRAWRSELQRHIHNYATGVDLIVIRDGRVALEAGMHVLLADADCTWLTPTLATQIRANGCRILLAVDREEGDADVAILGRVGAEATINGNAGPEAILSLCWDHAPIAANIPDHVPDDLVARVGRGGGRLVAVGGPAGVGRTEIAIGLAAATARRKVRTLLMDANEFAPTIAERLGLPRHPNLVSALDLLRGDGADHAIGDIAIGKSLARPGGKTQPRLPFDTLVGMAARAAWPLLREDLVAELLDSAMGRWEVTVADVAPTLESSDRWCADRYPATRRIVGAADVLVVVMEPSPTGLVQSLTWLGDAMEISPAAPVHLLVNRLPRDRFVRRELERELADIGGGRLAGLWFLPEDRKVPVAAWNGDLVGRGRVTRALAVLADAVLAPNAAPMLAEV